MIDYYLLLTSACHSRIYSEYHLDWQRYTSAAHMSACMANWRNWAGMNARSPAKKSRAKQIQVQMN